MVTDFWAHRSDQERLVIWQRRGIKEEVVASRERKKSKNLEVRVMFEPSRIAAACVAQAYERVVPITRRVIGSREHRRSVERDEIKRWRGGAQ